MHDAGDSEYEEHVLLSRKAVALHDQHAALRRAGADQNFFHHPAFSLRPLQGCVWPEVRSRARDPWPILVDLRPVLSNFDVFPKLD